MTLCVFRVSLACLSFLLESVTVEFSMFITCLTASHSAAVVYVTIGFSACKKHTYDVQRLYIYIYVFLHLALYVRVDCLSVIHLLFIDLFNYLPSWLPAYMSD